MRTLKHHEKKLLKKVDFLQWKSDAGQREAKVIQRYHIQKREDYQTYNRLCGSIRSLAHRLSQLSSEDPFRSKHEALLLGKLYEMHVVDTNAKIGDVDAKVTVSAFCRRRLAVVMCKLRMAQTVKMVRDEHLHSTDARRRPSTSSKATSASGRTR